jgi:3-oxoacyl-(acyl-carrier-protein) synthase
MAQMDSKMVEIQGVAAIFPSAESVLLDVAMGPEVLSLPAYICSELTEDGLVPAKLLRRLGRTQRLALIAAYRALKSFQVRDCASAAVCVGTGLGEWSETADFLENMIRLDEAEPKPTRFINSVHNSIASQLAIAFGFEGENLTFAHNAISFETALWHAKLLLTTKRAKSVLVCGADALSQYTLCSGYNFGWWRRENVPIAPMNEMDDDKRGTVPGEGCAAFVLTLPGMLDSSGKKPKIKSFRVGPSRYSALSYVDQRCEIDFIQRTLQDSGNSLSDVDFVLLGANGDSEVDAVYSRILGALSSITGREIPFGVFKHRCGEFCTSSALGLAAVCDSVEKGKFTSDIKSFSAVSERLSNVLFYNLYGAGYHSVCLIGK